jgi:hypothetical protein
LPGHDPEQAAIAVLREFEERFGADGTPPVPVERIAESLLDLLIEECDDVRSLPNAPSDRGHLSGMVDPPTRTIWLDRAECARSPGRKRFTIAHECGHWILHIAKDGEWICCRPEDVGFPAAEQDITLLRQQEAEANVFASELLMPEPLVVAQAQTTGCNLAMMAERFEVSVPAIRFRLLNLGLLPPWMVAIVGGRK